MLSYQHIYHAGGWADVHKHAALCALWRQMQEIYPALVYGDTHAGRGAYDLDAPEAQKIREYESGVLRLGGQVLPESFAPYKRALDKWSPLYPGSAACIETHLRKSDYMALCELHPQEHQSLLRRFYGHNRIGVAKVDGHEALPDELDAIQLPALVLIDPSYEIKTEYEQAAQTALRLAERQPESVVVIWYPVLMGREYHLRLEEALPENRGASVFAAPFAVQKGMVESRLIVLNASEALRDVLAGVDFDLKHVLTGSPS